MRKVLIYLLTVWLFTAGLTACSVDHEQTNIGESAKLVLTGTIGNHSATRASNGLMESFNNTPVNVYLFDNNGNAVGDSPMEYIVAADGTMTPPNGNNVYLPDDITEVSAFGFYPTGIQIQENGTVSLTVVQNQNDNSDYLASDLLFARVDAPKTDAVGNIITKTLNFNHLMAKVVINVTMKPAELTLLKVEIANVKKTVSFTPSTYNFAYSLDGLTSSDQCNESNDMVVANNVQRQGQLSNEAALIAPQAFGTLEGETKFIRMDTSAGIAWYAVSGAVDFLPGCTYTLNLAVRTDAIGTTTVIKNWELAVDKSYEITLE